LQALAFIIFIIVLQQLENHIIYPRVVGKSIGLPGMWVLLAVLVGGSLYGILGIIIGVPLTSVLYSMLRSDVRRRLKGKRPEGQELQE
jgi:predicted PurR-regulated permease PerM